MLDVQETIRKAWKFIGKQINYNYVQKTDHQFRVQLFMHCAAKVGVPFDDFKKPTLPNEKIRYLRAKLILEEALETIEALGFDIIFEEFIFNNIKLIPNGKESLIGIADGCADISVVTIGTLCACGINDRKLLEEVDANNLLKFDGGGYINPDGKWVKPLNHPKPDIEGILALVEKE